MTRHGRRASWSRFGGLLIALTGACSPPDELTIDPVVGSWTSSMRVAGEHNELELDEALDGEATIYFYFDGEPYYGDFAVDGLRRSEGVYQLFFRCEGDCDDFDFEAWCDLFGDRLSCEGDDLWQDYEFEWVRDSSARLGRT